MCILHPSWALLLTTFTYRHTIIDEADEMLNADWMEELQKIMAGGGKFTANHKKLVANIIQIQMRMRITLT